jgi:DNA repair ATPase RecN
MYYIMSNPKDGQHVQVIPDKEALRQQAVLRRINELQSIIKQHQVKIQQLQAEQAKINQELQQEGANLNFAMGALSEKQSEFQKFQ